LPVREIVNSFPFFGLELRMLSSWKEIFPGNHRSTHSVLEVTENLRFAVTDRPVESCVVHALVEVITEVGKGESPLSENGARCRENENSIDSVYPTTLTVRRSYSRLDWSPGPQTEEEAKDPNSELMLSNAQ
jgi:hypothetical protein